LQQPPIKRQVIVVFADMPLPRQFESDLLGLNVVESALQISVSAVIYASIKDRNDNTTTVHVIVDIAAGLPQATSKQIRFSKLHEGLSAASVRVGIARVNLDDSLSRVIHKAD